MSNLYLTNSDGTLIVVKLPSGNILVSDMQTGLYILDCNGTSTNIENKTFTNSYILFNQDNRFIQLSNQVHNIKIFDISGRQIIDYFTNKNREISTKLLFSGIYIYQLFDNQNQKIKTGKIILE